MTLRQLLLIAGLFAACQQASAQSFGDPCRDVERGRQAAGAVIGGLVGGLIGNGVAGHDVRKEGAALGAVLGAVAGSAIASSIETCRSATFDPYQGSDYSDDLYSPPEHYPQGWIYHDSPSIYSDEERVYWRPAEGEFAAEDVASECKKGLAPDDPMHYRCNNELAARECVDVKQVTRLPDGSEIHEPVWACRDAFYGDWRVED